MVAMHQQFHLDAAKTGLLISPVGLSIGGALLDALGWRTFIGLAAVLFFTNALVVQVGAPESTE
jgi:hypothetical protein